MSQPLVSVIVVSRGRPELLRRCLKGLDQLFYPSYELIIVADPSGAEAVREAGWQEWVKLVAFDEANISAARNAGIKVAAGEIVAFIDDDAVPEPTWLDHLIAAFEGGDIAAAGGFVRGRNGITFQWTASFVDEKGQTLPLNTVDDNTFAPSPRKHAVKTEGTNCAFRRDILAGLGGFDPAFRFYHDETDLNMRLREAGLRTAIVPLAQVHHGFAASDRRREDRVPTTLIEIGASTAVFLRKHCPDSALVAEATAQLIDEQQARLARHVKARRLTAVEAETLMAGLMDGLDQGSARPIEPLPPLADSKLPFRPLERKNSTGKSVCIAGRLGGRALLHDRALQRVMAGDVVTIIYLTPTTRYHRVAFSDSGFWEQKGGVFGRSVRTEPLFQMTRFEARIAREWRRVARLRQKGKFIT